MNDFFLFFFSFITYYIFNLFDISGHARASTIRYTCPSRLKTGTSGGGEMKERGICSREKFFKMQERGERDRKRVEGGGESETGRESEKERKRNEFSQYNVV